MSVLKLALRQLWKNPGFTTVAVLTLALGIGANTALFSVVHGVLLRPLPFTGQERLVTLWESSPAQGIEQQAVSPPTFADWQTQSSSFESLGFWTGPTDYNFVTGDGSEKVRTSFGSASLFGILGVEPQIGRGFLPEDDVRDGPLVAVLSHRLWQQRFASDRQVLGRSLTVDTYGRRTFTIVGVMPPEFRFPDDTELWLAAGWNGLPRNRRAGHWLNVLARLRPDRTVAEARAELNGIQTRIGRDNPGVRVGSEVSVVPLLKQTVGRNLHRALLVLWGVVAGVLLIACVNVANLTLARMAARQREISLRLALGAGRWRVIREVLTESVLVALLGGVLGTLFAYWGVKALVSAIPSNVPRLAEVSIDGVALSFTLGTTLLTGIVFGLVPAWRSSRTDMNDSLKDGSRAASGGVAAGRTRHGLVVAEVSVATLLLIGAGLMVQSFAKLLRDDRGIRAERVVVADLDFSIAGFTTWIRPTATRPQVRLQELLERVRQLPGVQSAGAAYRFLRSDNRPPVQTFAIYGRPPVADAERPTAEQNAITPGYLRTLGVSLLRGRDFTEADTLLAPGAVIVNETFVRRFFPKEDPLGQFVTIDQAPGPLGATNAFGGSIWCEIVGVVSDVKSLSAQPEAVPEMIRPYWQWPMQSPRLFVRTTGDVATLAAAIRRETKAVIPNLPTPSVRQLSDRVDESMAQPRFQAGLLALFGALALVLAAVGIYGVLAYTVTQRRREMGVRLALGAQRRDLIGLVMGQGLKLAAIGVTLGLVAALALTRLLQSLLYEVTPTDPWTFLGVAGLLMGVSILACWTPAARASQANPMEALRAE